jgi:hypothetical protein
MCSVGSGQREACSAYVVVGTGQHRVAQGGTGQHRAAQGSTGWHRVAQGSTVMSKMDKPWAQALTEDAGSATKVAGSCPQ